MKAAQPSTARTDKGENPIPRKVDKPSDDTEENLKGSNKSAEEEKGEVSPTIWVPMALLVAVIFSIGNTSTSIIAKYEIRAVALQSIGRVFGNILPIIVVAIKDRYGIGKNKEEGGKDIEGAVNSSLQNTRISWFKWFYDIYFFRARDEDGNYIDNKWTNQVQWKRIWVSCVMILIGAASYISFVFAYSFAIITDLNTGVLMSIYSVKPIISSILFYIIFKQTLKLYEMFAMGLWILCAFTIALSSGEGIVNSNLQTKRQTVIISCCLLSLALFLAWLRAAILKYFFGKAKEVNISVLFNLLLIIPDLLFVGYFVHLLSDGVFFTTFEFLAATFGGMVFTIAGYLIAYVNVRGKAGVSDALIETSVVYQTLFDVLLFSRYPNLMQYIGLLLGLGASLFLILWNRLKMK